MLRRCEGFVHLNRRWSWAYLERLWRWPLHQLALPPSLHAANALQSLLYAVSPPLGVLGRRKRIGRPPVEPEAVSFGIMICSVSSLPAVLRCSRSLFVVCQERDEQQEQDETAITCSVRYVSKGLCIAHLIRNVTQLTKRICFEIKLRSHNSISNY